MNINSNTILIVNDIDTTIDQLKNELPQHYVRVIRNESNASDEFQKDQKDLAIKEAYISTNATKYIILCGATFRMEAQNGLLKVLEESPKNIVFIIVTTAKSALLPTIHSRLQIRYLKTKTTVNEFELDLTKLDLKQVYNFLKENQKIPKGDARKLVEAMLLKVNKQKIKLSAKELDLFSKSIRLLELNSKPINVLSTLLLTLLQKKRH